MPTEFQAVKPQNQYRPGNKCHPYATIAPGKKPDAAAIESGIAQIENEDPIVLVLPSKLAPEILSEEGEEVTVSLENGVVTWTDDFGLTHQLGDEEDPFDPLATRLLRSASGLLVLFMDMQTGEHLSWAIFKA